MLIVRLQYRFVVVSDNKGIMNYLSTNDYLRSNDTDFHSSKLNFILPTSTRSSPDLDNPIWCACLALFHCINHYEHVILVLLHRKVAIATYVQSL